jgi:O-antigen/teichoic acid export membrane protein
VRIFTKLIVRASSFLNKGHKRSVKAKRNIILSLLFKGQSVIVGFIMVPILLNQLDAERYGIWLTLSSIVGFASFFDFGLGNGLRIFFAKAVAQENRKLAKSYVSTTYITLSLIFLSVLGIFHVVNPYLNWAGILNSQGMTPGELSLLALVVGTLFIVRFLFELIGTLLVADQRSGLGKSFGPMGNLAALLIILVLIRINLADSLINVAVVLVGSPVIVLIIATIYFFSTDYKQYRPSFKYFQLSQVKSLLGLGTKFFIIQLGAIILMTTDNVIVAQLFGPEEVVVYQVASKYMGITMLIYIILLSPIWSAVTEAYYRKDFNWILNTIQRYQKIAVGFIAITIVLIMGSEFFYEIWLSKKVVIPLSITLCWGLNSCLRFYGGLYNAFVQGTGKVYVSVIVAITTILCNIPLSILFGKYFGLGSTGVILATNVSVVINSLVMYVQYRKLVGQTAQGIWNK